MNTKLIGSIAVGLALGFATITGSASAQTISSNTSGSGHTPTDKAIEYHGGSVMVGSVDVYFIWYGCWGQSGCGLSDTVATQQIVSDFTAYVGFSPYFTINSAYPNAGGQTPSGGVFFGAGVSDPYSRGSTLTESDLAAIVAAQFDAGVLPFDPSGIYVVVTSADVTVMDGATQFCLTCCNLHGVGYWTCPSCSGGIPFNYVFVGNPARCPGSCGLTFSPSNTPSANWPADAIVSWLAHALNGTVTNPSDNAWYDRYGLENSEKCEGTYGTTYTVTNPDGAAAQANVKLGPHNYLLQQNWVNGKKGHCGMSLTP